MREEQKKVFMIFELKWKNLRTRQNAIIFRPKKFGGGIFCQPLWQRTCQKSPHPIGLLLKKRNKGLCLPKLCNFKWVPFSVFVYSESVQNDAKMFVRKKN
jgi:hypothetical protein